MAAVSPGRRDITSLYVLKAVCALFVVIAHFPFTYHFITQPVDVIAVPCFFMITGYFLQSCSIEKQPCKACKWSRKAFILTLVTNCAYLLFNILVFSRSYTWGNCVRALFIGDDIACHLWYLAALWQSLLLLALFIRFFPKVIVFLPLLLLHNVAKDYDATLFHLFDGYLYSPVVFTALPYLALGYLINSREKRIAGKPFNCWVLVFVSLVAAYAEYAFLSDCGSNIYKSTMLVTPFLSCAVFSLCLVYKNRGGAVLAHIGKQHSANIYYLHLGVGALLVLFSQHVVRIGCYKFIVIYIVSLLLSCLLKQSARFVGSFVSKGSSKN